MGKETIIDAHAHIFPDAIAMRASEAIAKFYDLEVVYDGKLDTLLEAGSQWGVRHFIVQSVATVPEQVSSINRFIAEQMRLHPEHLTGLGTLHPASDHLEADMDQIVELGLKGIKLHPDFQKFHIDDPAALAIFERAEGRLPLLVHSGDFRYDYSHPQRLVNVLKTFPKLTVVAAHFGGWSEWEEAAKLLVGTGVYVDTSSSLYGVTPERVRQLIDLFGPDHVLFGTDFPMWEYGPEMERFERLGLDAATRRLILSENAKRVFGLTF